MNLIFGMKVIYLMLLDSLVKIVVERCTRNTTKVPTMWNINYQIIKNNNTTTQNQNLQCELEVCSSAESLFYRP